MIQVTPVILCGGSGTRLWPLSRTGFPKQFLCLTGQDSLFQQAAARLAQLGSADIQVAPSLLVAGEDHRFLAAEQLREAGLTLGNALLEPAGRNTAPALTLAALAAQAGGKDPVLVVTPADQAVVKTEAFTQAMQQAIQEAIAGTIVILGIAPDRPETGYGYIQAAGPDLVGMGGAGFVFTGENDADIMHNSALVNINVLEACVRRNSKRIFYSSSACMYPEHNQLDPENPTQLSVDFSLSDSDLGMFGRVIQRRQSMDSTDG